jgi:ribosomal protein S15P/S13E
VDAGAAAAGRSSHKQGGPESSNNFFTSEGGLWAYAQTLGEQVAQLTDKIKGLEGHIGTLERTKAAQEVQITDLTVQVTRLRQEVLDARAQVPPLAAPPLAQP